MAALFVDTGNGYHEGECIRKKVFIPGTQTVRIVFDIGREFSGKTIEGLRFDLDEEIYRVCSVVKAQWENGESAEIRPANGIREEGRDRFYTLDPQYEVVPKHKVLELILKVGVLPTADVERQRESVEREVRELKQKLKESRETEEKYRRMLGEYRSSITIRALHKLQKKIRKR